MFCNSAKHFKSRFMNQFVPDFFVVGQSKSGTTALDLILRQVPGISMPRKKELHKLSFDLLSRRTAGPGDKEMIEALQYAQDPYLNQYSHVDGIGLKGEVSPSYYFYSQHVAPRIWRLNKRAKIIVILRDQAEKAVSQYVHLCREGRERMAFQDALMEEKKRELMGYSDMWLYARSSLSAESLRHYYHWFGCSLLVIRHARLKSSPNYVVNEILKFLDIPQEQNFPIIKANTSYAPKWVSLDRLTRNAVRKFNVRRWVPESMYAKLARSYLKFGAKKIKEDVDSNREIFRNTYALAIDEDNKAIKACLDEIESSGGVVIQ